MTIETIDLRLEAAAESGRLTAARALVRGGDAPALRSLDGGAPWILIARRSRVRRALRGRVCTVWRVALEDTSGRTVESRLVAVLLDAQPHASQPRRSWIRALLHLLQDSGSSARWSVEAACADWAAAAAHVTHAFIGARARREHDIAAGPSRPAPLRQDGLFDRSAERARDSCAAAIGKAEESAEERREAIVNASLIAIGLPQLLLVLVP